MLKLRPGFQLMSEPSLNNENGPLGPLAAAAKQRQHAVTARIQVAVQELESEGLALTVSSVARRAQVSRTSIYAREHVVCQLKSVNSRELPKARQARTDEERHTALLRRLAASQSRNRILLDEVSRLRTELAKALGEVRRITTNQGQ